MVSKSGEFVIYHLCEALVGAMAEAENDEALSRCLRARAKLRLVNMTDDDLRELADLVACPPERSFEKVYQELKGEIEELKQTADAWIKDLMQSTALDPGKGRHHRVLIVENEPSLRKELVSAFTQAEFIVVDVAGYFQTLQKLSECNIDLIVMDSLLSDWDGFDACLQIRKRFNIPVILLGNESDDRVWERVLKTEADHYEVKPCQYMVLVAISKAVLRRYEPPAKSINREQNGERLSKRKRTTSSFLLN